MTIITCKTVIICLMAVAVTSCGSDEQEQIDAAAVNMAGAAAGDNALSDQWSETTDLTVVNNETAQGAGATVDLNEIPYPLYPNGSRYRIGGEGDLKIVLFQTEDTFEQVDAYYQEQSNLPRLSAMSDYVRYSTNNGDIDPWETSRPGIVIHQFNTKSERQAVGADATAVTNIIMSFE